MRMTGEGWRGTFVYDSIDGTSELSIIRCPTQQQDTAFESMYLLCVDISHSSVR
jgi:hypothetical protein